MEEITLTSLNEQELPLVVQPSRRIRTAEQVNELIQAHKPLLKEKLLKHGCLLFRGFPLENPVDFANFIHQLDLGTFVNYVGSDNQRDQVHEGIYTATEAAPFYKIPLHNELSFVDHYPRHIYFFCEIAPQVNGETVIADARKIYKAIDPAVRERFINQGLRYSSYYFYKSQIMKWLTKNSHKSWTEVFKTESKDEVEKHCREHGFEFTWHKNDWLEISHLRPAVMKHPETDEEVWFNQAHLYDLNPKLLGKSKYLSLKLLYWRKHTNLHEVCFADHGEIPREDLYHVMDVLDENTVAFPWKRGDLMVLDNVLAMHGRSVFEGKRRILAAMTS